MSKSKIGWVGLGKMGVPMSGRLIKAGYEVVVYNRTKEKEANVKDQGATSAATPVALLEGSEVIILMVSDDEAVRQIFTGDSGLLTGNTTGKTIINMSTVSPGISKEMAALCQQKGNYYLDAPVSGSVKQAEEGQLVIMVGGDKDVYGQVKPIFDQMGKLALWMGEQGAGNTAKLAINTLLGIQAQGLAEAAFFAKSHGIQLEDLFTLLQNSALGNPFGKIKGEAILQNNYQAAFALKHIAKDLCLAKDEGLNTPLGQVVYDTFLKAESTLGEQDIISIFQYLNKD